MKKLLFASLFGLFVYSIGFAQNNQSCPKIEIKEPESVTSPGYPMAFSVLLGEEAKKFNLQYHWTSSLGTISEGLNTNSIKIATTGLAGFNITATVEIKGLPNGCMNKFSSRGSVASVLVGDPVDEYGKVSFWNEQAILDNLMVQLDNDSESIALIYLQLEDTSKAKLYSRISQITRHFAVRKFPIKNKILFVVSKSDAESTILYVADKDYKNFGCKDCQIIKGSEVNSLLKNKKSQSAKRNR